MADQQGLTTSSFPEQSPVDRSAAGLSYQDYQTTSVAQGQAMGRGRRVAPNPSAMFSSPPAISGGQFAGSHAKSMAYINPEDY